MSKIKTILTSVALMINCMLVVSHAQTVQVTYKAKLTEPFSKQIAKDKKKNPPSVHHIIEQMHIYEKQINSYSIDFHLFYRNSKSYMSLIPSDTMGRSVWNYESGEFEFSLVMKDDVVIKDFTTDSIKISRVRNANYCVKGVMPTFCWGILNERKSILGFPCVKAVCTYQDKEIVAWFTPSIPISDGPLEYQGLPGLILELRTWDNGTTYKATKVQIGKLEDMSALPSEVPCSKDSKTIHVSSLDEQWKTVNQIKTQARRKHRRSKQ